MRDVYVAEVDLETGKMLVAPSPAAEQFVGSNRSPDWSPDGRFLAYLSKRDAGPNTAGAGVICIRSVKSGEVRELRPALQAMYRLRWFPDGRSLSVTDHGSNAGPNLFRVDAGTGEVTLVHRNVAEGAFSPDGRTVYYWRFDETDKQHPILARDLETGREKQLYRRGRVRSLALSPDGRQLAFLAREGSGPPVLKVLPAAGGDSRELTGRGASRGTARPRGPPTAGGSLFRPASTGQRSG